MAIFSPNMLFGIATVFAQFLPKYATKTCITLPALVVVHESKWILQYIVTVCLILPSPLKSYLLYFGPNLLLKMEKTQLKRVTLVMLSWLLHSTPASKYIQPHYSTTTVTLESNFHDVQVSHIFFERLGDFLF